MVRNFSPIWEVSAAYRHAEPERGSYAKAGCGSADGYAKICSGCGDVEKIIRAEKKFCGKRKVRV